MWKRPSLHFNQIGISFKWVHLYKKKRFNKLKTKTKKDQKQKETKQNKKKKQMWAKQGDLQLLLGCARQLLKFRYPPTRQVVDLIDRTRFRTCGFYAVVSLSPRPQRWVSGILIVANASGH